MSSGYLSIIPQLHPAILLAAAAPLVLAILLFSIQMIRIHLGSWQGLAKTLQDLADLLDKIDTSSRENLPILDSAVSSSEQITSEPFRKSWYQMKAQIDHHYHGPFLPSSSSFFQLEQLAGTDHQKGKSGAPWQLFWLLQVLTVLLPAATAWLVYLPSFTVSLILGLYGFLLLAILKLIFLFIETLSWQNLSRQFLRFTQGFDRIIPVLDKDSATSFEIARVQQDQIMTSLNDSLKTIQEQQEQGMAMLAGSFAAQLTDTVDARMSKLAGTIKETQHGLSAMNTDLAENMNLLKNILTTQRSVLDDAGRKILVATQEQGKMLSQAAMAQEKSILHTAKLLESILADATQLHTQMMARSEEMQTSVMEKAELLHRQTAELSEAQHQNLTVLSQQQTSQMNELHQTMERLISHTSSFQDTASAMLQTLNGMTGQINEAMANTGREIARGIQEGTADNAEAIEKLTQQAQRLREDYEAYFGRQEEQARTTLESLDHHIQEIFTKVSEEMRAMLVRSSQESKDNFLEASRVQQELALRLNNSQNSIEAAISGVNHLVSGITDRMNEAMSQAGREIATGIKEVTGDNAEAITRLAEQSQKLKEEYERYFSSVETQSRSTFEDMDFHVQNIISKVSEEFGTLLSDQRTESRSIMESYKDSTTNLMLSFEQQANSINLYAKEISYDVGELSQSLKDAVSEFSLSMQDTVRQTLEEFDAGLAELTLRISNTVESICDAVEDLPEALGRK